VTTNAVATFRNAGISLIDVVDDQKVPFPVCVVTPHTLRSWNQVHDGSLPKLTEVLEGTEDEDDNPSLNPPTDDEPHWKWKRLVRPIRQQILQGEIENRVQTESEGAVDTQMGREIGRSISRNWEANWRKE
jgi:hypothetical protein